MELYGLLLKIAVPLLFGLAVYVGKSFLHRIENLEKKMEDKITDSEVRQLLDDKINPMKDDLKEIKNSIDKLYSFFIRGLPNG